MDLTTLAIILGVCAFALVAIYFLVPTLLKKAQENNIPVEKILDSAESIAKIADTFLQSLNLDPKYKGVLELIIQSAQLGVKYAEQLYKSNQLPKEDRKQAAVDFVKKALTDAGIEVTADRENIINMVIESAVFNLPKTQDTTVQAKKA